MKPLSDLQDRIDFSINTIMFTIETCYFMQIYKIDGFTFTSLSNSEFCDHNMIISYYSII